MRILKNQTILQRQSENYIKNELSNVAAVIQSPQIFVEYYAIDPDLSTTLTGLKNIEEYIGENSTAVYNFIDNLPMSGIDNLVTQTDFDEEKGFDEELQSSAIILPNTIVPKPYDCFVIKGSQVLALYVVTNTAPVTVRSNPFVEIQFRLFSRDIEVVNQLKRQVRDNYETTVTAIGLDKNLIIKKSSLFDIEHHINQYMDLVDLYTVLFYDKNKATFIYDGLPAGITTYKDTTYEIRQTYIDMLLWKFMFDEGIIIYDDVITYANNNFHKTIDRIYTDSPDIFINDHHYRKSILYRIFARDTKSDFAEYRYPLAYEADARVSKFQGRNIVHLETYSNVQDETNNMLKLYNIWCDEFIDRIRNNIPYEYPALDNRYCIGCNLACKKPDIYTYNPSLRNVIIQWFNNSTIDWESIEIEDVKTVENYYLIPLVLSFYKKYIFSLQK